MQEVRSHMSAMNTCAKCGYKAVRMQQRKVDKNV